MSIIRGRDLLLWPSWVKLVGCRRGIGYSELKLLCTDECSEVPRLHSQPGVSLRPGMLRLALVFQTTDADATPYVKVPKAIATAIVIRQCFRSSTPPRLPRPIPLSSTQHTERRRKEGKEERSRPEQHDSWFRWWSRTKVLTIESVEILSNSCLI